MLLDSLKSIVTRTDSYDQCINLTFDEFTAYYGLVVEQERVQKARDKTLVKNVVRPGLPGDLYPTEKQAIQLHQSAQ